MPVPWEQNEERRSEFAGHIDQTRFIEQQQKNKDRNTNKVREDLTVINACFLEAS